VEIQIVLATLERMKRRKKMKRTFKIVAEGPSCSGKTTFLGRILRELGESDVRIRKTGEHELTVEMTFSGFPEKEEDGGKA